MVVKERLVLANEIWLVILQYFFTSLATFKAGMVVDVKFFKALMSGGILSRFRRVSKNFAACAFEAFYKTYEFKFAMDISGPYSIISLPPSILHTCLRRIQVVVYLTDHVLTVVPGADTSTHIADGWAKTAFVSAAQLFAHCPGARTLLVVSRMPFLKSLDITIRAVFANPQAALAVYRSAGIALRADEVKVDFIGQVRGDWHPELAQALGVTLA